MNESIKVPTPEETGNSGTQVAATEVIQPKLQPSPFPKDPLVGGIEGLTDSDARGISSDAGRSFIRSAVNHFYFENADLKREVLSLRTKLENATSELHRSEKQNVQLETELRTERGDRPRREVAIVAGAGLLGYTFDLYTSGLKTQAILVGVVGLVLLLFSWIPSLLSSRNGEKK